MTDVTAQSGSSAPRPEREMDPDRPAPGRLELVRCLLNSDDRFHRVDHAADLAGLNAYLGPIEPGLGLDDEADLAAFRTFREAVRSLLLAPTSAGARSLDRLARSHPLVVCFDEDGHTRLVPHLDDRDTGLARLCAATLAAIHEARLDGHWQRLRACQRFDCGWIFYDASGRSSARWCSTDPCGNVMKTRAYRARRYRASADTV